LGAVTASWCARRLLALRQQGRPLLRRLAVCRSPGTPGTWLRNRNYPGNGASASGATHAGGMTTVRGAEPPAQARDCVHQPWRFTSPRSLRPCLCMHPAKVGGSRLCPRRQRLCAGDDITVTFDGRAWSKAAFVEIRGRRRRLRERAHAATRREVGIPRLGSRCRGRGSPNVAWWWDRSRRSPLPRPSGGERTQRRGPRPRRGLASIRRRSIDGRPVVSGTG
jgi:hypothetical protein